MRIGQLAQIAGIDTQTIRFYEQQGLLRLCLVLRLSARLHHARCDEVIPEMILNAEDTTLSLRFPRHWLEEHPLTLA